MRLTFLRNFFLPFKQDRKVIAALKKIGDLNLLSRYQRGLLYGGGGVLTLAILCAGTLAIYGNIRAYISDGKTIYLLHKAQLLLEIETKQAALRRGVIHSEMFWHTNIMKKLPLVEKFEEHHGQLTIQANDKVQSQLVLGVITPEHPASSYDELLSFSQTQGYTVAASALQREKIFSGYFINTAQTFMAFMPPPKTGDPLQTMGANSIADLIHQLAPHIGNLKDPAVLADLRKTRRIQWLPPAYDPFTGEEMVRLVQPAFHDDVPFIIFVSNLRMQILLNPFLRSSNFDGNFLIIEQRTGKLIFSKWKNKPIDPTLTQKVMVGRTWAENLDTSDYTYRDGAFTISEPLSDTGWILAYAYSWKTIFAARWPWMASYVGGTFLLITLLWLFIFFFDTKILKPILQRSERVFESESLNRIIIGTAPVGLGLISIHSGEVILQNDVLRSYEQDQSTSSASLPRRFLDLYRETQRNGTLYAPSTAHQNDSLTGTVNKTGHDVTVTLADGNLGHLLVNLVQSKYQGTDVLLYSFSDISTHKQIEQNLQEVRAAAEAANHAKSSFLATMSHEIRTPLNAILGNLELLACTSLSELQQDRLQQVDTSSRALLEIISDILDFSKIESGQMTLEKISCDIVDIVEQVLAIFAPLADVKGVDLFYTIPPELPRFYFGDPTRIRQIVLNLLSNAIKFTVSGKVCVNVFQKMTTTGSMLTIDVSDTGIGITASRQSELFLPFTQAETSVTRLYGGTGLGLALCLRLTELMNGTISVQSRKDVGSTFSIHLPLAIDSARARVNYAVNGMPELAMLCPSPDWQAAILPHLASWGLRVTLIAHPRELPTSGPILLMCGSPRQWSLKDEDNACAKARCVIDAQEDGPRVPVKVGNRVIISCYALSGLRQAVWEILHNGITDTLIAPQLDIVDGSDKAQHSIRVLVVEDHPVNLALIGDQLEILQYQTSLVDRGIDALELLKSNVYDIVLTDLSMPAMDGYTLTSILRERGFTLPIIAITAHASQEEHQRCIKAGITDILLKPMSLSEIDQMMRKHIPRVSNKSEQPDRDTMQPILTAALHKAMRETSLRSLEIIGDNLAQNNASMVLDELHAIKGSFAMLRQWGVVNACAQLEEKMKMNDFVFVSDAIPTLTVLIADTLKKIGWVATLSTFGNTP